MPCDHKETTFKKVDNDYFGLVFSATMEVCDHCGSFLWTKEAKSLFNEWLVEQKKNHRDHFIIQASLSDHSTRCLAEIAKNYPGTNPSMLIRAMTSVFLHFMEEPEYSEMFEAAADSEIYESFLHGSKHIVKVQFNPSGMLDLHSWSSILHMKPTKVVEEAVYRLTSVYVDNKPDLKKFWETRILPQISLILKSTA